MKETKIVAIGTNKGGQSKTSTAVSLGAILARKDYKVLLVDLDAQCNLTKSLLTEDYTENVYTAMTGKSKGLVQIKASDDLYDNLYVAPSSINLGMADIELSTVMAREMILHDLLEPIKGCYDFILLDCPPALNLITTNAFAAATDVIIPMTAEVLPSQGFQTMYQFVSMINRRINPKVRILGVLLTRWEEVTLSRSIEKKLRDTLGDLIFTTKIRKNITIAAAPIEKKDIVAYSPHCNGAKDYLAFAEEFLERITKQ